MRLFPLPPGLRVHYCQRLPALTPAEVALYVGEHGVLSNVTPNALHWHAADDGALDELAALRFDWQAPWSREHGIQPSPGALGLSVATLECVVSWPDASAEDGRAVRWVRVGSPAIAEGHAGRTFAQVFTRVERGADGQPHYGGEAGVYRVADGVGVRE